MHIAKTTTKYMKQTSNIKTIKNHALRLAMAISVAVMTVVGLTSPYAAHAATGDAYFSLSPSSGSYTVGDNLVLTVSETSTSGDNTNAVQVNLSYPSSQLQYK